MIYSGHTMKNNRHGSTASSKVGDFKDTTKATTTKEKVEDAKVFVIDVSIRDDPEKAKVKVENEDPTMVKKKQMIPSGKILLGQNRGIVYHGVKTQRIHGMNQVIKLPSLMRKMVFL